MLPSEIDSGCCSKVQGMNRNVMTVPLHCLFLSLELVQGRLPTEGIQVILGNDFIGTKVWKNGHPSQNVPLRHRDEVSQTQSTV